MLTKQRNSDSIILYPVTMNDVVTFQIVSQSITVRKNSIFREKNIIKMTYLDFLFYCISNEHLEIQYKIDGLSHYLLYAITLLKLCCKDSEVILNQQGQDYLYQQDMLLVQPIIKYMHIVQEVLRKHTVQPFDEEKVLH